MHIDYRQYSYIQNGIVEGIVSCMSCIMTPTARQPQLWWWMGGGVDGCGNGGDGDGGGGKGIEDWKGGVKGSGVVVKLDIHDIDDI